MSGPIRRRHIGQMKTVTGPPPDMTAYIFVCPDCRWQVEGTRRARSDLGGHEPLMQALAQAALDHKLADHPQVETTATMSGGQDANVLIPVPLPSWWVHK